jgi:hypothetical protein
MKNLFFIAAALLLFSCNEELALDESVLEDYIALNSSLELDDLVACAAGREEGFLGSAVKPTDVFFYPISGATDFRYYEAESVADSLDFSKYIRKDLDSEPLFNGYLWKFNNIPFSGERMGVVTYTTPGKMHICTPIRMKTNLKPTEVNPSLLTINNTSVNPSFSWEDGMIDENVIYFHIVSDANNNLISGTYTIEKNFTFYNLRNVVFNITDPNSNPQLEPNQDYTFTLMGVSEDNWVNLFFEKSFRTE